MKAIFSNFAIACIIFSLTTILSSCGSGTTDSKANIIKFSSLVSNEEVIGGSVQTARGSGQFTLNLDSGRLTGTVLFHDSSPTAVHIHQAYAGAVGEKSFILEQDAVQKSAWHLPNNTILNSSEMENLRAGAYYIRTLYTDGVTVTHTRGQILNEQIEVYSSVLKPASNLTTSGYGYSAVTLNTETREAIAKASVTSLPERPISVGHVHDIQDSSSVSMELTLESTLGGVQQFSSNLKKLSAANMAQLQAGRLYLNLHSGSAPNLFTELTGAFGFDENDILAINIDLSALEVVSSESEDLVFGSGQINVHRQSLAVSGYISFYGQDFELESIKLHEGFAGSNGAAIDSIAFESPDGVNAVVTESSTLSQGQFEALNQGKLYINMNYNFENEAKVIRGQLLTPNVEILVSRLKPFSATEQAALGFSALTLNTSDFSVQANTQLLNPTTNLISVGRIQNHYNSNEVLLELSEDDLSTSGNFWSHSGVVDEGDFFALKNNELDVVLFTGESPNLHIEAFGTMHEHADELVLPVKLSSSQAVIASNTQVTANTNVTVDLHSREISATITFPDSTIVNSVQLGVGYAGEKGSFVEGLQSEAATVWKIADSSILTMEELNTLLEGRYFFLAHILENGVVKEIRGQILPDNVNTYFAQLQAPEGTSGQSLGMAALTINTDTFDTTVFAQTFAGNNTVVVDGHVHELQNQQIPIIHLSQSSDTTWQSPQGTRLNLAYFQLLESRNMFVHLHRSLSPLIVEMTGQFIQE